MGAYKQGNVVAVVKMGAYIHEVLIFYGYLLSWQFLHALSADFVKHVLCCS